MTYTTCEAITMNFDTKIRFYCDSGANHQSCREETQTVSEWSGLSPAQWAEMDEDEQRKHLDEIHQDWMGGHLEYGWHPQE